MQLLVIHPSKDVIEAYKEKKYFYVQSQANLHLLSQLEIDVLVVYEKAVTLNQYLEKKNYVLDLKHQFFVMEEANEETEVLCKANGVIPIVFTSHDEVATFVTNTVYPENPLSKRVFMFAGAEHRVGTTTIVHSVAEQLATHIKKKVMVVSLADKPNDDYVEFSKSSIDHIRTSITSKVVTFTEIFKESDSIRNYRFLAGPRDMLGYRRYQVEDIINLIEVLRNQTDSIVLIDAGSNVDNPLFIGALSHVSNRFMVITNQKSSYKALDNKIDQVFKPAFNHNYSSFLYLLNQFDEDVESTSQIEKREGICAGTFPLSRYRDMADEQEVSLSTIDDEIRRKAFAIAKVIATKADCEIKDIAIKTTKFPKFLQIFKGGEVSGIPT